MPGESGACIEAKRAHPRLAIVLKAEQHLRRRGPIRACIGLTPPHEGPCGPERLTLFTAHARDPALMKEAMAHFREALALHEKDARTNGGAGTTRLSQDRLDELTYHVARARMAQGDMLLEELIQMRLPSGLVFNPENPKATAGAEQKYAAWTKLKQRKLDEAKVLYEQVLAMKNPYFVVAAEARISQLYLAFANGLFHVPAPAPLPPPPAFRANECDRMQWNQMARGAFCDHVIDTAEPLEQLAKEHLLRCLSRATELGEISEWSRLCEEELHQLSPNEYPLPSEILFAPAKSTWPVDVAPVRGSPAQLPEPRAIASPGK